MIEQPAPGSPRYEPCRPALARVGRPVRAQGDDVAGPDVNGRNHVRLPVPDVQVMDGLVRVDLQSVLGTRRVRLCGAYHLWPSMIQERFAPSSTLPPASS